MKKLTKEQIEKVMQAINDLYFTDKLITIKGNTSTLHGDNLRTALESLGEEEKELQMCPNCHNKHSNPDMEGYCSEDCFDN